MHERGEKSPRFNYRVKLNLIISHVIIAWLTHEPIRGGPTPKWIEAPQGGPTRSPTGGPTPFNEK